MALIWKHVSENYPDFKWYARFWDDNYVIPSTFEALIPSSFDVSSPLEIGRLALANEGGRLVPVNSEALIIRGAAPAWPSEPPHGPESLGHGRTRMAEWLVNLGTERAESGFDARRRPRGGETARLPRTAGRERERATAREAGQS